MLGCAALLVVSENSTFWVPAVTFMARHRRAWWQRWVSYEEQRQDALTRGEDSKACANQHRGHCQLQHAPAFEGLSTSVLGGGKGGGGRGAGSPDSERTRLPADVLVFTRGLRCYPLGTTEPVSDAAYRSRFPCRVSVIICALLVLVPPRSVGWSSVGEGPHSSRRQERKTPPGRDWMRLGRP